jgi:hypothetical protein
MFCCLRSMHYAKCVRVHLFCDLRRFILSESSMHDALVSNLPESAATLTSLGLGLWHPCMHVRPYMQQCMYVHAVVHAHFSRLHVPQSASAKGPQEGVGMQKVWLTAAHACAYVCVVTQVVSLCCVALMSMRGQHAGSCKVCLAQHRYSPHPHRSNIASRICYSNRWMKQHCAAVAPQSGT